MPYLPDVVARYLAAYNRRDVDGMLACLAKEARFENRTSGSVTAAASDREAFAALAQADAALFVARRQKVLRAITVADTTLTEIAFTATVAADPPPGWTAGKRLSLRGASLFRVRGGLIDRLIDES